MPTANYGPGGPGLSGAVAAWGSSDPSKKYLTGGEIGYPGPGVGGAPMQPQAPPGGMSWQNPSFPGPGAGGAPFTPPQPPSPGGMCWQNPPGGGGGTGGS